MSRQSIGAAATVVGCFLLGYVYVGQPSRDPVLDRARDVLLERHDPDGRVDHSGSLDAIELGQQQLAEARRVDVRVLVVGWVLVLGGIAWAFTGRRRPERG